MPRWCFFIWIYQVSCLFNVISILEVHWDSLIAQLVKNWAPAMQEKRIFLQCRRPRFNPWVGKIHWRRLATRWLPIPVFLGFPGGLAGKESACNAGDLGLILGLGKSPGEGNGYPLQYSGLENSMDCIVHRVTKSQTQLNDFHFIHLIRTF